MGLFDRFKNNKKEESKPDFTDIDSMEKVKELARQNRLFPMYCMPLRFNGEESDRNRLYVPAAVITLKDRCDDMIEKLLREGKVNGYSCTPQYKGDSFVPAGITVVGKMNGKEVFTETINIW